MAVYFLDANGSNTVPYDTIENAAQNLQELVFGGGSTIDTAKVPFNPGDFFEVSSSSGEIYESYFPILTLPPSTTMRSYSGNTSRPVYRLYKGLNLAIEGGEISGIDFYKNGTGGGPVVSSFIGFSHLNPVISNCSFDIQDPSGGWVDVACLSAVSNGPVAPSGAVIENNLIQNVSDAGISLGTSGPALNTVIMNNTIYNSNINRIDNGMIHIINTDDRCAGIQIVNNICLGTDSAGSGTTGINITDVNLPAQNYNCISGVPEYGGAAVKGLKNIHADPKFVSASTGDFKLLFNSPCINVGAGIGQYPNVPIVDIRGVTRPQLSFWVVSDYYGTDIGCYEMLPSELGNPFPNSAVSGGTSTIFPSGIKGKIRFLMRFDPKTLRQIGFRQYIVK